MSHEAILSTEQTIHDVIVGQWYFAVGLDFKNQIFLSVNPDNPHIGVSPDFIEPLAREGVTRFIHSGQLTLNPDGTGHEHVKKNINIPIPDDVIEHYQLDQGSEFTIEVSLSMSFKWEIGHQNGFSTLIYNLGSYEMNTTNVLIGQQSAETVLTHAPLKEGVTPELRQDMVRMVITHFKDKFSQDSSDIEKGSIMLKYIRDAQHKSLVVDTGVIIYEMTREPASLTH